MDLLFLAARDLTRFLTGPLLLLWLVVGLSAPFLFLSAVLSLRRIAKAQERIAAAVDARGAVPAGAVLDLARVTSAP